MLPNLWQITVYAGIFIVIFLQTFTTWQHYTSNYTVTAL